MATGYTFTSRFDEFAKKAEAALPSVLAVGAETLQRQMKNNLTAKGPSKPGQFPGRQSGALERSINWEKIRDDRVRVGTPLLVGRWMERGVFTGPKRAKMLAIPINDAARRMYATLDLAAQGGQVSLRTKGNLRIIKKKDGRLFLMETTGIKRKLKKGGAVFRLKSFVVVLPRPWVKRSFVMASPAIRDKMAKAMEAATGTRVTVTQTGGVR